MAIKNQVGQHFLEYIPCFHYSVAVVDLTTRCLKLLHNGSPSGGPSGYKVEFDRNHGYTGWLLMTYSYCESLWLSNQ